MIDTARPFVGLSFLLLAIGYSFLQGPVMAVELPEISRSLAISDRTSALAATIMMAVSGVTLIAWGRAADQFGRRRICLYGVVVVLIASVLTAVAWNGFVLVFARALQGLGTAMLLTAIGIVGVMFADSDRRDLAFALLGASVGAGLALAPLAAAASLALGSWRLSFWINIPILIVVYVGIRATVPESRDETATAGTDWPGTILLVLGVLAGLFVFTHGESWGWLRTDAAAAANRAWPFAISPIAFVMVLAVAAFVGFERVEAGRFKRSLPVLMDAALLKSRRFGLGCLVSFLLVLGGYALQFMVPVFGRVVLQEDSLQVALLTATSGVGIAAGAVLAAPVGGRLGGRVVVLAGLALAAAALAVTTYLLAHQLGRFDFILVLFAFGIGYGLVYAKITEVVLLDVPRQDVGLASGMLVASRTCAMAIGSAALTAIMLASSDGTSALSETESASSHTAFGLGAAFLVAAFFVALAIPRDTQVHSNASAHGAHDLWKKYGV